mgnify:CR=1 FL=1
MNSLLDFFTTPLGLLIAALILVVVVAIVFFALRSKPSAPREPVDTTKPTPATPPPEAAEEKPLSEVPEVVSPKFEEPEDVRSRMQRLRARMASSGGIGKALLAVFARGDLSAADWEEIEDTLLLADVGLGPTEEIIARLREEARVRGSLDSDAAKAVLREELLKLVGTDMDRSLNLEPVTAANGKLGPAAVLVVGVNGTGKTTTVGKMARLLRAEDKTVVLGAADTFRAAASEQLATWGSRVGVPVVASDREGGDPASVAFEAVKVGVDSEADVVIVDTAGRLQTKTSLMHELGKIRLVMEKQIPVGEVLLVLDATTGQNGMRQAQVFAEAVGITGIVLTKLDGSAKGGIVISVQKELGVPVKLVGLGEGPDDLAPFDPSGFVDAIVGE